MATTSAGACAVPMCVLRRRRRRAQARGELLVLLACGAGAAPVVHAAIEEAVARDVVLDAQVVAHAASDERAGVHEPGERSEHEDGHTWRGAG